MSGSTAETAEYDFVVVGSGAGGGPLAANLALAGHSVLLLEAGDDHECLYYSVPIMQAYASEDADMRWDFFVDHYAQDAVARQDSKYVTERGGVLYPRGSTLGGSTAISAMVTIYPHPSDWDALAAVTGDESWGAAAMRDRIDSLESWRGVDPLPLPGEDEAVRDAKARRGKDGWLTTTRAAPSVGGRDEVFLDVIGAMERTSRELFGIPEEVSLPRDPNAADTPGDFQGLAFIPVAVRAGHRNGARERVAEVSAQHGDRLHVSLNSLATRVLFESGRAVGVEYHVGRKLYAAAPGAELVSEATPTKVARARREVILAGGAFNTPQLLMLSGIGPADHLTEHGIEVVVDAPGVGANLHDRYEVSVVNEIDRDFPLLVGANLDIPQDPERPAAGDHHFVEWRDAADGPFTTNGTLAAVVARSSVAGPESDLIIFTLPIDFRGYYPGYASDAVSARNRLSILVLKAHTTNRAGRVRLNSTDPRAVPSIDFHYFEEGSPGWQQDLIGVAEGVGIARQIARDLQLASVTREVVPGAGISTEQDVAEFVRREAWGHHACGTARIGRADDPDAVLDGDFRVRGVAGLRVVDASVFPDIPGFFIASAVYLISEKASEVIIAEHASTNETR